jgi:protein-S-isoprenylcysteine O-methyltransferase Ste14
MKQITQILLALLATAGARFDGINRSRWLAIWFIGLGYFSHRWLATEHFNLPTAMEYFVAMFLIRYLFLFGGFVRGGFVPRMIKHWGEAKAWNIYEFFTSVMFFQRSLTFGFLTDLTQWTVLDYLPPQYANSAKTLSLVLGFALMGLGTWVNVHATLIIGIDVYYYKDLFLRRALGEFKVEGPYKYFSNPMYGVGQLSAYGAALAVGSVAGLMVTLLNQISMYIFYFTVEKPHVDLELKKMETFEFSGSVALKKG